MTTELLQIIEIDASEFFNNESANWKWCVKYASFSNRELLEFIVCCDSLTETNRMVESMKILGCTYDFIDAFVSANEKGARMVLFYS